MKRDLDRQYIRKHVELNNRLVKYLTFICYEEVLFSYNNNVHFVSNGYMKRPSLLFMKCWVQYCAGTENR
jgi:hypothetical protein